MSVKFNEIYNSKVIPSNKLYLYNRGNTCDNVTGGWSNITYYSSGFNVVYHTDGEDFMYSDSGRSGCASYIISSGKIDFNGYSKLTIMTDNTEQGPWLFLSSDLGNIGYMYLRSNTVSSLNIVGELSNYYAIGTNIDSGQTRIESDGNIETVQFIVPDDHTLVPIYEIQDIPAGEYHLGMFIYTKPSSISHIYEIYLE